MVTTDASEEAHHTLATSPAARALDSGAMAKIVKASISSSRTSTTAAIGFASEPRSSVGADVGDALTGALVGVVGICVGVVDGAEDGPEVARLGATVGTLLGTALGAEVGAYVAPFTVGIFVGTPVITVTVGTWPAAGTFSKHAGTFE